MRKRNQDVMKKIYEYADEYYFTEGHSPTMAEIAEYIGSSRSTAYYYLQDMVKNGMIEYDGKTIFTDKIKKTSDSNMGVRVYDNAVPCGELEEVKPEADEYVNLPASIFGNGDLYILRTKGDSMVKAKIEPGDLVVVENTSNAETGDIIVALGNETDNSLKRLMYDKKKKIYYLHPENDDMEDIYVKELKIQGVAKFVIKKL